VLNRKSRTERELAPSATGGGITASIESKFAQNGRLLNRLRKTTPFVGGDPMHHSRVRAGGEGPTSSDVSLLHTPSRQALPRPPFESPRNNGIIVQCCSGSGREGHDHMTADHDRTRGLGVRDSGAALNTGLRHARSTGRSVTLGYRSANCRRLSANVSRSPATHSRRNKNKRRFSLL